MVKSILCMSVKVLEIVRAAESLALGTHLSETLPPKSPTEHHDDKMHKTTTIVMSAHTLDTQPQVCTILECASVPRHSFRVRHSIQILIYYIFAFLIKIGVDEFSVFA